MDSICRIAFFGLLLTTFFCLLLEDAHAYIQPSPLKVRLFLDQPTHDGLYLQNDRINVTLSFENHSNQTIPIIYSFEIKHLESGSSVADGSNLHATIPPGQSVPETIIRGYSAGNYRIYVTAGVNGTAVGDLNETFFWVANPLELYSKQTLEQNQNLTMYTLMGVGVSGVIAASALTTAIWTRRHNQKAMIHTENYAKEQLKLMQESNQELKESNMLTRAAWL